MSCVWHATDTCDYIQLFQFSQINTNVGVSVSVSVDHRANWTSFVAMLNKICLLIQYTINIQPFAEMKNPVKCLFIGVLAELNLLALFHIWTSTGIDTKGMFYSAMIWSFQKALCRKTKVCLLNSFSNFILLVSFPVVSWSTFVVTCYIK
jgi:hypothetical protein